MKVASKGIQALIAASLVGIALAACDGNPVSDERGSVFRLFLSPSVLNLTVNGEKKVTGYTVNRYGEATFDRVTASACDAKVTVTEDTDLLPFEPPTRVVAHGSAAGTTCITFTGGGMTDSVRVVVQ